MATDVRTHRSNDCDEPGDGARHSQLYSRYRKTTIICNCIESSGNMYTPEHLIDHAYCPDL